MNNQNNNTHIESRAEVNKNLSVKLAAVLIVEWTKEL